MKFRHRLLFFLFFLALLTFLDRVCLSVAGADIQHDLGLTPSQWGWILGIFALSYALGEIPTGAMGDRVGPRRTLTRIVLWWSIFTSLTGLCTGFASMLAVRFLFGAGEAGAFPNCSIVIARWFPLSERGRAQGFVWMASRLGAALAPVLVIPLQRAFGWRACLGLLGGAGVVWAIVWRFWFRDRPEEKSGITRAEIAEIASTPAVAAPSLPWRAALRQSNLWWIMLMYFTYCWSAYFFLSWLHVYLVNARGYSKEDLLRWSWLPFVCGAVATILGGWTSDRLIPVCGLKWARRSVGLVGLGSSAVFIAAAYLSSGKVASAICLSAAFASSDFMLPAAFWAVCVDIGCRRAGSISAAMNMAGQLGSFGTSLMFGYMVEKFGSYDRPLIPIVALTVVSALTWLKIDPTRALWAEEA